MVEINWEKFFKTHGTSDATLQLSDQDLKAIESLNIPEDSKTGLIKGAEITPSASETKE